MDDEPGMLKADGLDEACIGIATRCSQPDLLVYDVEKVLAIFMERDGMTRLEAEEFFAYNVEGGWHGPGTPLWFRKLEDEGLII